MLKIEVVQNGWLLTDESDPEMVQKYVFQEREDGYLYEKNSAEAFAGLLWRIKDLIGPTDSRYSAHRVYIEIKPGDKHSSHPDNQEDDSAVVS
jgi:hypothetical protein